MATCYHGNDICINKTASYLNKKKYAYAKEVLLMQMHI